jgi:predicted amino acid-binding ACT domain protein
VKRQRRGEDEDELVAGVNKMLAEIGAEVVDVPYLCFRDSAGVLHVAGPKTGHFSLPKI